jgi:hypothetical protein
MSEVRDSPDERQAISYYHFGNLAGKKSIMKKILLALILLTNLKLTVYSQEIPPAPEDKSVIYFVRSSILGSAINFSFFDSTAFIGKANGTYYIRYECAPGYHLFWARSENRDYVQAEVEAGKIYFILAVPQMGGIKAGVKLVPMDASQPENMKDILKFIAKKPPLTFTSEDFEKDREKAQDVMIRGLEKYSEEKAENKVFRQLDKQMFYKPG